MSNFKLSRRTFITSAGAVFTLPLLESMFPFSKALAAAATDPKRYVLFYFPSGTYNRPDKPIWATPNQGAISASNTSLAFSPFSSNYGDITSINNLRNPSWTQFEGTANIFLPPGSQGDEHQQQALSYATCANDSTYKTMTSFENVLGNALGKPALVLSGGVTNSDRFPDSFVSYMNGTPNAGLSNPGDLYRKLLGQIAPSQPMPASTNNSKSILDSSIADFNALIAEQGSQDKNKLNEFLQTIRDLETSLAGTGSTTGLSGGACIAPTLDPTLDNNNNTGAQYMAKMQAMNTLIKVAFACDISRSVSIMVDTETSPRTFGTAPSNLVYMNQNIDGGFADHISISHASGLNTQGYNLAVTRDRVLLSLVLDLANKLKASNDPTGSTMLDNTIIHAGYGVIDGNHSYFDTEARPLVLVGGKNMVNPGQSKSLQNNTFNDLYYTIATKLGANIGGKFQGSSTLLSI